MKPEFVIPTQQRYFFLKFFFVCHFSYSDLNPSFEWYVSSLWMEEHGRMSKMKEKLKAIWAINKAIGVWDICEDKTKREYNHLLKELMGCHVEKKFSSVFPEH